MSDLANVLLVKSRTCDRYERLAEASFLKDKAKDRTVEMQGPVYFHHLPHAKLSHTSSYLFLTVMLWGLFHYTQFLDEESQA